MSITVEKVDKRRIRSQVTRQKIIAAAIECYQQFGVENTYMEDVANQAGIGRATLYRHFNNQDEILTEVVISELGELRQHLKKDLATQNSPAEYIVKGCLIVFQECPKQAITPLLFKPEASSIISRLSIAEEDFVNMGMELMQPFYQRAKKAGLVREGVTLSQMVEWITRFIVSILANPSQEFKTKKQVEHMLNRFLLPSLLIEQGSE